MKKTFFSIFFYLFKDRIRFFIFLLVIDMAVAFYVFNSYILPVLNQDGAANTPPIVIKKVKVKKELYNEVIRFKGRQEF